MFLLLCSFLVFSLLFFSEREQSFSSPLSFKLHLSCRQIPTVNMIVAVESPFSDSFHYVYGKDEKYAGQNTLSKEKCVSTN